MTDLRSLSLSNVNLQVDIGRQLAALPALARLTALILFGSDFEAEDGLGRVERLTTLRRLRFCDCRLPRLPPQLTVLTDLEDWCTRPTWAMVCSK